MTRNGPSLDRNTVGARKQGAILQSRYPGFDCSVTDGKLICRGTVSPSPESPDYRVRIEYRVGKQPAVWVEDPPLSRRPEDPEEPIPHTFNRHQEGKECPCTNRVAWKSGRYIAQTIVPWLREWLAFYEIWRQTGVWCGGGVDHNGGK